MHLVIETGAYITPSAYVISVCKVPRQIFDILSCDDPLLILANQISQLESARRVEHLTSAHFSGDGARTTSPRHSPHRPAQNSLGLKPHFCARLQIRFAVSQRGQLAVTLDSARKLNLLCPRTLTNASRPALARAADGASTTSLGGQETARLYRI